jgi:hypothetical protein
MMTRGIPVVVFVLVLLWAVPATAQTQQQARLKGLTAVEVFIENLDDDHASCGITKTGLTTAASKALLDNGVRIIVGDAPAILYVNLTTLYREATNICVSNVEVQLYEHLYATPNHSAQPVVGPFLLAEISGMDSSIRADHGQRIRDAVVRHVEAIAVDIRIANQ